MSDVQRLPEVPQAHLPDVPLLSEVNRLLSGLPLLSGVPRFPVPK